MLHNLAYNACYRLWIKCYKMNHHYYHLFKSMEVETRGAPLVKSAPYRIAELCNHIPSAHQVTEWEGLAIPSTFCYSELLYSDETIIYTVVALVNPSLILHSTEVMHSCFIVHL
jgi:hypothetical protein